MNEVIEKPTETALKPGYGVPPVHTQFKPGISPNPGGKPVKARNRINARFLNDLLKEWDKSGAKALHECATDDPATFIRVVASLQPKEFEITKPLDEVTDEQLDAAIITIRAILAAQGDGVSQSGSGQSQHPEVLQTVPEAT